MKKIITILMTGLTVVSFSALAASPSDQDMAALFGAKAAPSQPVPVQAQPAAASNSSGRIRRQPGSVCKNRPANDAVDP